MRRIISLIIMTFFGVALTFGQTTTGRLSGVVSGPDGVLPSATVVAKDNATNKELTVTAKDDGSFVFPQLEFGTYTVTVTSSGFKTFIANAVKIDVGRDYTLEAALEVGNVQENVTITAGADVVTANTAQISNTVSPQQILSLPLLTRNPLALVTLQAGAVANTFQNTSINGMRTTGTNITRDGINVQDAFIRTNATDFSPSRPSVDDTGEFTITTTNQESDQGGGGAQIRLVTPRGTKDLHGSLFAFNRNSQFGANNFFNNRAGVYSATDALVLQGKASAGDAKVPRPFRNRNQFGGKVSGSFPTFNFGEGGPMFEKNKGFYFFAYEGIRDPVSISNLRTILTPSARAGTFSFNRATAGNPINSGGLSCPSGAAASVCTVTNILTFAQSQGLVGIPSTIDPVVQARVLSLLPTQGNSTDAGDQLNTTGYALNRQNNTSRNSVTSRVDVDATDRDSVNVVFTRAKEVVLRPDADTTSFGPTPGVSQVGLSKSFVVAYRRVISSNILNEFRSGLNFGNVPFSKTDATPSFFFNSTPSTTLVSNLVSYPENRFLDQGRKTKGFNVQDNVDWTAGKHSIRFGGQLQYFNVVSYNAAGTVPSYRLGVGANTPQLATTNFANQGGAGSVISNAQLTTANNLLALLGGIVNAASQSFNASSATSPFAAQASNFPYAYSNHSAFVLDRWNVARGLTVTAGIRYEIYPALTLDNGLALEPRITDPSNLAASLLNTQGTFQIIGGNAGKKNAYYKTDKKNFAPSVGVAYTPHFESGIAKFFFGGEGKTVLRGGYSQSYVNDSILTALNGADSSNVGLGTSTVNATLNGTANLNDRLSGSLTAIAAPVFAGAPTFLTNNSAAVGGNVGNVSAVDPNLQVPKVEQYSFGIQREFFGNLALEVRYVGSRSHSLLRAIDFNQIDIFNNGILADFNRALANDRLTGNAFCTTAGCQALQIFQLGAGAPGRLGVAPTGTATGQLALATFNTNLRNGAVADLARAFVSGAANNQPTVANPTSTPFVKIMPGLGSGTADVIINGANFNYNSLQIEVRRRLSGGLALQANYTFSKNLTDGIGTSQGLFDTYLDNNNKGLDRQRADFDQTHTFNLNSIYQLPFGKGRKFLDNGGVVDKVFGGWELSGIFQASSGAPITFVDTRGTLNRTTRSARQTPTTNLTNEQVADLAGTFFANGNIYYINPSVIDPATGRASNGFGSTPFTGQAFFTNNPGQTGNLRRTAIDGPKFYNLNMTLMKNIKFGETTRLQLRMEAFNVLNNTNFSFNTAAEQIPNITSASFGQITAAGAPRILQFAARFEF